METEVMTSVVETSPIWLNPLVWIVGLIIVVGIAEAAKTKDGKNERRQKRKPPRKPQLKKRLANALLKRVEIKF